MWFRIAIGRCGCQPPYRNVVEERVCKTVYETLAGWRRRLPADVAAVPTELFEEQIVDGYRVTFGTYKLEVGEETLIVCQALLHTWSRPTFLAIGNVGRMYAEGLLLTKDGNIEPASDNLMWQFR